MRFCFFLLACLFIGCGPNDYNAAARKRIATQKNTPEAAPLVMASAGEEFDFAQEEEASSQSQAIVPKERKIVYTATIHVVVEQFDGIEKQIGELVKRNDGFVASANIGRYQGSNRNGSWKVRIPVANYQAFLDAVGNIGVPTSRNETAADVTAEFFDLEARIANKQKLEKRIIELLDRPEDKIQHVIEVERELARVREEIEQMQGRKRYLTDITSLTTVTINVDEEQNYVPPQAPTLGNRIRKNWNASLVQCRETFENAVVFAVRNAIGFGIFVVALLIAWSWVRSLWRRQPETTSQTDEAS